ncbi:beta-phosphoglucomutase [Sporolactobacillus sp. Y61]|uniref:Beta-phosphoglucomutase n=1 Tax=Sporolactobacillus sp. Y61 TaxID=3160863 RepID=A0AAU8IC11_9BACL
MKAVIFDLDGVLTDTAKYHFEAWKNLARSIGIEIDETFNQHLLGISRMESLELILQFGGRSDDFSALEKDELAARKNEAYRGLISGMTPADLLPGIGQFLRDLKEAGIKIGLASASRNGPFILDSLQITSFFDAIVDPAKLKKGKPDPEIFAAAAAQLKMRPAECAGIEDAVAGIQAINAAGMFSVGIATPAAAAADWRVASTAELTLERLKQHFTRKDK